MTSFETLIIIDDNKGISSNSHKNLVAVHNSFLYDSITDFSEIRLNKNTEAAQRNTIRDYQLKITPTIFFIKKNNDGGKIIVRIEGSNISKLDITTTLRALKKAVDNEGAFNVEVLLNDDDFLEMLKTDPNVVAATKGWGSGIHKGIFDFVMDWWWLVPAYYTVKNSNDD